MHSAIPWSMRITALVCLLSFAVPAHAQPARHKYYHYYHALWELRDAHKNVKADKETFNGHREKGLAAMTDAMRQIELILAHLEVRGADPVRGDLREAYKPYTSYPHLNHALFELRESAAQLRDDRFIYGGHKDAALRDINEAIVQIDMMLHRNYHLHHALWELRDARTELAESKHNFGEHREKSLAAMGDAIRQIELVLKGSTEAAPTRGDTRYFYGAYANYPHVRHSLHELREAETQLKESRENFGGHKEAAIRDIHRSIVQMELLLERAPK